MASHNLGHHPGPHPEYVPFPDGSLPTMSPMVYAPNPMHVPAEFQVPPPPPPPMPQSVPVPAPSADTTPTVVAAAGAPLAQTKPPKPPKPPKPSKLASGSTSTSTNGGANTSPNFNADTEGTGTKSPDQDPSRPRESIPTACLACRTKHLKCDGSQPCSRCVASGADCAYVASRRGYKGPRRAPTQNPNKRQAQSPPEQDPAEMYTPRPTQSVVSGICPFTGKPRPSVSSSPNSSSSTIPTSVSPNSGAYMEPSKAVDASVHRPLSSLAERCLDSFFQNFHASHPFVLPKDYLLRLSHEASLEPLLSAIRWAGSLFIDVASARASLLDEAYQRIRNPSAPRDGFLVQAMMVLIIGMDGMAMNDKARELLLEAETLAVEIALNTRPFAAFHGRGMPILEESWRRTWWDLFVIDGMIAGVHRMTNFALFDIPTDVALPCEEHQYLSGTIPKPSLLADLEDQEFSNDERQFSSFAYRILCGRNLGKFMRTPPIQGPDDENLARVEALLTNWRLHLPASKRDALDSHGRIDEMMFQAHMMVHATSILLHQPHSQLDSSPAATITSCAPHQAVLTTGQPFNSHTRHVIASASAISRLVTLPRPPTVPLTCHTHFFTCVLTLSSIVHLSKWALRFVQYDDDDLRQLLRLNIGALSELSRVWPAAERARGQVRGVATDIYHAKRQVQAAPQFWLGLTHDQITRSIAADDDIIDELDLRPSLQQ